ncbi:MAG: methyltransferase domain-containing protein [Candidatus Methanoplasma sp.]|jgi:SAM-dependent methyltransferase|nr:methyltransferase domain-containing protein [Candidatus Methanoplasma sp.]
MYRDSETTAICSEWEAERNKHPFVAERLDDSAVAKCWDDSAETYSGSEYAGIREEIALDLLESGILGTDRTMMDIGCGTGLYEILLHSRLKSIFCIDGSEKMIGRLRTECINRDIRNVSSEPCMWEKFDTADKYDIVFSSLCPPLNNPESLLRMESYSSGLCIYVSSANPVPGVSAEIWKRLKKDYSFAGYNTEFPYRYLLSIGRKPTLKFYSEEYRYGMTVPEAVSAQERYIGKYREITPQVREIIESAVGSESEGGMIRGKRTITLGMLVWKAGDADTQHRSAVMP